VYYDSAGSEVPQNYRLKKPELVFDKSRRVFTEMRQIARDEEQYPFDHSRLAFQRVQRNMLARVFYKQAIFMRDYADDYSGPPALFSSYYPYYQIMNYYQLRTYFAWRARARENNIAPVPLSYVYLYVYELLNHIGVASPEEGLDKLMALWRAFRALDSTVGRYILRWVKDYHGYYPLPRTFGAFLAENGLQLQYPESYPREAFIEFDFNWLLSVSKYRVTASAFWKEETKGLITGCVEQVLREFQTLCENEKLCFHQIAYKISPKKAAWHPFDGALFFQKPGQPDRAAALSENEIYFCYNQEWSAVSIADGNRAIAGYILRQTEKALRAATGFKHKMTANYNAVDINTRRKLSEKGISLEALIHKTAAEFFTQFNRTVVEVDERSLERIRREALDTQAKLIVGEDEGAKKTVARESSVQSADLIHKETDAATTAEPPVTAAPPENNWDRFRRSLSETEAAVLTILLLESKDNPPAGSRGFTPGEPLAGAEGVLPEVLADGINQKAQDAIGDNILEYHGEMEIYEEYREALKTVITHGG
ncbi:MAG: TerB N-terminal domain-containing protein, partial [Clostridiales bacterium]|nr:TerB N-terminal domain-containing protein [Clostridiales bacterium]